MKLIKVLLNESDSGDQLAMGIYKAIDNIDPNLNYRDFASAVATVIKNEYGTHNIEPFMKELHSHLGLSEIEEGANDNLEVEISYTNYGNLYAIKFNGEKQRGVDEQKAIEYLENTANMKLPSNGYDSEALNKFTDALKAQGIEASTSEMDVD